jgi:hypothetical protein
MKAKVFYPPCQWLNPNLRDYKGRFYCEKHLYFVHPAKSVKDLDRIFNPKKCAPDCPTRSGKTRIPHL